MSSIRNIIFDFGNVLFDLNLGAFSREMQQMLGGEFAAARAALQREKIFEQYETGGLSTEEFLEKICSTSGNTLSPQQVEAAWNAIFIGMPARRFEMLLRLRQQYKVFLLSNINELHERWIDAYMLREHRLEDYQFPYFDGVYFSHLIRLRKPEPDIYEYVLADAELNPAETLFFDDLPENVEAARRVGIQGIWHEPGTEIEERLLGLGLFR